MKMNRMYENWGFVIKVYNIRRNKYVCEMCAGPEWINPILWDNVCAQISIFVCLYAHSDSHPCACFLLNIALPKHVSAKEPHADLGAGDDICMEKKSFEWAFPVLLAGATFGASCCLITRSLDLSENHLHLGCWKEERDQSCPHLCAAARGYAAARNSPGLWAPEGVLSTWVIPFRGLGWTIQIKIRADSKLCLCGQLSLILHIPEDEQTQRGFR